MSRKPMAAGPLVLNNMDAKHASLMQDYRQLTHDFFEVEDQVNAAKIRKETLQAEVRFLRRRLKKLRKAPSNLKENETAYATPHSTSHSGRTGAPEPSALSPTNNQLVSMEIPAYLEPPRTNGSDYLAQRKSVNENAGLASALKTSVFRNKSSEFVTAMSPKRKISWQDQISLECK